MRAVALLNWGRHPDPWSDADRAASVLSRGTHPCYVPRSTTGYFGLNTSAITSLAAFRPARHFLDRRQGGILTTFSLRRRLGRLIATELGSDRGRRGSVRAWRAAGSTALFIAIFVSVAVGTVSAESSAEKIAIRSSGGSFPGGGVDSQDAAFLAGTFYVWAYGDSGSERRLFAVSGQSVSEIGPEYEFSGGNRAVEYNGRILFQAYAPGVGVNERHLWEFHSGAIRSLGATGPGGMGGAIEVGDDLFLGNYYGLRRFDGQSVQTISTDHVRDTEMTLAPDGETLIVPTDTGLYAFDGFALQSIYSGHPQFLTRSGDHLFFHEDGWLRAMDWDTRSVTSVQIGNTNKMAVAGGGVYLRGDAGPLFCTAGACAIVSGPSTGAPSFFTEAGGFVYFRQADASGNDQLWAVSLWRRRRSDPTCDLFHWRFEPDAALKSFGGRLYLRRTQMMVAGLRFGPSADWMRRSSQTPTQREAMTQTHSAPTSSPSTSPLAMARYASCIAFPMVKGPNSSNANVRSLACSRHHSIRASFCSFNGSGDSFQVLVRWNVIPSAARI